MAWLARLSFAQALRWALVWPATVIAVVVIWLAWILWLRSDAMVGWSFGTTGPLPLWLALTLTCGLPLLGPPLLFLAVWGVVRR